MNYNINIIEIIKSTINVEYQTLLGLFDMDFTILEVVVKKLYSCKGKIVVSGIGKSAIVARKVVATLNSTGSKAIFLHTADALHGDVGILQEEDILWIISKSGESREIKELFPAVRNIGAFIVGMVSNSNGYLAQHADIVIYVPVTKEADIDDLAPTASTIAHISIGDAIAMSLKQMNGFSEEKFARLHPGGLLGKKLNLKVEDLAANNAKPSVLQSDLLSQIIYEISSKRLGASCVQNLDGEIIGIITDGDIRRLILKGGDIYKKSAFDIMSKLPKCINNTALAVDAIEMMKTNSITQLIVVDANERYVGMIHIHDIIKEGIN
ncbi:MAG: KpsF/GutQ family sugar-phosphate isomerase [Saprospiraceae bacterium]|nr:KpsF/GutQ family sugar-phosphate isomerase [Saprospiraceae bacterium]